jgi:hypothetical protein
MSSSRVASAVPSSLRSSARIACIGITCLVIERGWQTPEIDPDALPQLTAREVRTGSGSAVDRALFSSIGLIDVDRDGNVIALDVREATVQVVSPSSSPVRSFGRRGRGPGEFMRPTALAINGDSVLVYDAGTQSVLTFRRDGRFVSAVQTSVASIPLPDGRIVVLNPQVLGRDGYFVSAVTAISPPRGTGTGRSRDTTFVPRLRYGPTSLEVDTVGAEPVPPADDPPAVRAPAARIAFGRLTLEIPQPPSDALLRLPFADGVCLISRRRPLSGPDARFSIARFGDQGRVLWQVRFRTNASRYEGAVLDTIASRAAQQAGDATGAAVSTVRRALDYPPFQSPVYAALAGMDGSVWLRREDDGGTAFRWIAIAPTGRARAQVSVPRNARLVWARGDDLVAVVSDSDGFLSPVRLVAR